MKTLETAFASAFVTGVFALAGYAGSVNGGMPPWTGTAICGAIGLLVGLGVVYPSESRVK